MKINKIISEEIKKIIKEDSTPQNNESSNDIFNFYVFDDKHPSLGKLNKNDNSLTFLWLDDYYHIDSHRYFLNSRFENFDMNSQNLYPITKEQAYNALTLLNKYDEYKCDIYKEYLNNESNEPIMLPTKIKEFTEKILRKYDYDLYVTNGVNIYNLGFKFFKLYITQKPSRVSKDFIDCVWSQEIQNKPWLLKYLNQNKLFVVNPKYTDKIIKIRKMVGVSFNNLLKSYCVK